MMGLCCPVGLVVICFSCPVVQGYGLTETAAGACVTHVWDTTVGHTGPPLTCTEIKLEDVPDMHYLSTDKPPRGEICLRGPNIFHGYYKAPEQTQQAIDENGWFHTGDVGKINDNGTITIIDRQKDVFKLSQGEYVAPSKIEDIVSRCPFVLQSFVHGNSLKDNLVAIVVPDPDTLLPWAASQSIANADNIDSLCQNPEVNRMVLASISQLCSQSKLPRYEYPVAISLQPVPFSIDNNLLTPTFKNKRPQLSEHFAQVIDSLYDNYHPHASSQ